MRLAAAFRTQRAEWQAVALRALDGDYLAPHCYMRLHGWREWCKVAQPYTATPQTADALARHLHHVAQHVEGEATTTPNTTP